MRTRRISTDRPTALFVGIGVLAVILGVAAGALAAAPVHASSSAPDAATDDTTLAREVMQAPPVVTPELPTVDPNRQLGRQVHIPILNYIGNDDRCESWIEVQNIGCDWAKAVLVAWGEPGFCPPQAAGPLKVECTGLLKPGSTWNLINNQIPNGAKGGMLFMFSARQLSEFGLDGPLGFDDVIADVMCETLFFGVVGDADDYRRFKKAYNEGGSFAGIPQDIASGTGYLAVDVLRDCPGDVSAGVRVTSKYNGIAGDHLGTYDPVYGGFGYYVPLVYADKAQFNTWIYIQNGGLECSSVEVWFKAQDDCLRARICAISTLAPGETYQLDASDCVGPGWQGSAWVRTSQPMGVAVDVIGRDVLMTYVGEPTEINYTFNPYEAYATPGNQVAYGPLTYSEYQGWDTGIQVMNLSPIVAAKVKVYFLDRSGDVITTLVDWVCPQGSQTFFLPVVYDLPGNWVGSVRVESQEWLSPGAPRVLPPNIVAVASMIKYSDVQRTEAWEAIAYNLLPEHKVFDWQLGSGSGGLDAGVGLIAIPSLVKDLDGTGVTSELAITNVIPKPGFTDFAIYMYDQNGLLDYVCEKLNEKQVEYIDLQRWGYINNGYKGSAVISATYWEHDVWAPDGSFERNLVGLAAMAVERSRTFLGQDVAGDEAAGARGIPFALSDFDQCPFGFASSLIPICPGVPGLYGSRSECPESITVSCRDCPITINDAGMVTAKVSLNVPAGCVIDDLDVRLDITHTSDADLQVFLAKSQIPVGPFTYRKLFGDVCGSSDNVQAVLDDEADQVIGAVCPPSGFLRYQTQTRMTLRSLYGEMARGEWILRVDDDTAGNSGRINDFT
ncbi:MAG: hypothetical protein ACK2T6_03300, partial [Anaerolineae bacterium]